MLLCLLRNARGERGYIYVSKGVEGKIKQKKNTLGSGRVKSSVMIEHVGIESR